MDLKRPTLPTVYLKDCEQEPPPMGASVIALNKSGVLCFAQVDRHFYKSFDAWMEYPCVPYTVKKRQSHLQGNKNVK